MSCGYAARLSYYAGKGLCGLPEREDSSRVLDQKLKRLCDYLKPTAASERRIVVLTGAGISTAAGIPDFRGPNGVWTKEEEAKKIKKRMRLAIVEVTDVDTSATACSSLFPVAAPTFTHLAIARLVQAGIVTHVITQVTQILCSQISLRD